MPEQQSNEYTYIVRIYGDQAAADARKIRTTIVNEFIQSEQQMAQAVNATLSQISSQTRRLSYNATRIQEATALAQQFAKAWAATLALISGSGSGTFDQLVLEAQKAYDQVAGHSIFSDLYRDILGYYQRIAQASKVPFTPLTQEAAKAATEVRQQVTGVVDAAGRLRWPAGTTLGGKALGGIFTSPEQIDAYNKGILQLNDIMPGAEEAIAAANVQLEKQPKVLHNATEFMSAFTDQLNEATLQYFGLRRLGYGLEQMGSQLARAGRRNVDTLIDWAKAYADFNGLATRAAAAMEMNVEQQRDMEEAVLADTVAMRLFEPEDIIEGLRVWAAGTGLVVRGEEDLQRALEQTRDIQLLAAFGAESLGETMTGVGGALAEFGLGLSDVDRVSKLLNFTAAKTFAEISDVTQAFRLVGPLASSVGISIEETAAAIGMLSDENIKGTMAGRAFRQMLIQLSRPTEAHNKAMNQALGLNEELGQSWRELVFPKGEFIGLANYIDLLAAATEKMNTEQKTSLLSTIATANELPALISLIDAQTEARKDGINVLRAWVKWTAGIVDEEVEQFVSFMERTEGVAIDTSSNMFSFWQQQSDLFYDSEQAKANELERRWKAMQLSLGRVILEEGAPVLDALITQLEKLVQFASAHPGLVTGIMAGAAAELLLGNVIQLAGQMLGVIANFMILRGAFSAFGGAVGTFQMAVQLFSQSVGADITRRRTGAGGDVGVGTLGLVGILAKLIPTAAIILGMDQPSERQREYENLLATLRDLNITAEQWDKLFQDAQLRWKEGEGAEYGRARTLVTPEGQELDVRGVLEILEAYEAITDEQRTFLEELREADMLVDVDMADLPEDLQGFLDGTAEGTITVYGELVTLTPEEIEAVQLFDEMEQALADLWYEGQEELYQLQKDFDAKNEDELKRYLDKREDLIRTYTQKERDYWTDLQDKLADIAAAGQERLDKERASFAERLAQIHDNVVKREQEVEEDNNSRIEELTREHQKRLQRMEEDHRDTLFDLAVKRDAYGIWREMRDYSKRLRREEEDYQDSLNKLKESNKKRLQEIRDQAKREEDELRKSHAAKMKEIEADIEARKKKAEDDYEKARKRRLRDHQQRLQDLKDAYEDDKRARKEAFDEQYRQLEDANKREYEKMRDDYYNRLLMLRGMYDDGIIDYQQYLEERLRQLDDYLRRRQDLLDTYPEWQLPEEPAVPEPAHGGGGNGGPGGGDVFPTSAPFTGGPGGGRVTVAGDLRLQVDVNGNLPPGAEQDLRAGMTGLFEEVIRNLEVTYA